MKWLKIALALSIAVNILGFLVLLNSDFRESYYAFLARYIGI